MNDPKSTRKKGYNSLNERMRWLQLVTDMEREGWQYELEALIKDHEPEIKKYKIGEGE
jgi:hypothetical protein